MRFYLSSYKLGNESHLLTSLLAKGNNIAIYISNAFDAISDMQIRKKKEEEDREELKKLGFLVEHVDLRDFFGNSKKLYEALARCKLLWLSGGNVFVLRKAMQLSGFDRILDQLLEKGIVYGGYSAAACVLSPSLKGYHIVDNPSEIPYEDKGIVWEGLNQIEYNIAPHFDSHHPESEDIKQEIQYCIDNHIPYKPLKDGEVIIL